MLQTISIVVSGKVQGVYYRQGTREKARELGITGCVENKADGTVFILATGTEEQLQSLVTWCHTGPPRAAVKNVLVEKQNLQTFESFFISR